MASDVAVPTAVARPRIHVERAVKSFSGRVVVDEGVVDKPAGMRSQSRFSRKLL